MKNPRITAKERGLIKGALRRAFSRSELRKQCIENSVIKGLTIPERPRVKTWCKCSVCGQPSPKSYMVADHIDPVVPVDSSFEDLGVDELVNRMWCPIENLQPICPICHEAKTKQENSLRRANKKARLKKSDNKKKDV